MNILISGVGIAGPTLAYWLAHHGFEPTLVERAPRLRTEGYVIDFWGSGFDVAERMGLADDLKRSGYDVGEVRFVGASGRRAGGFDASVFRQLTRDRFTSLPRSELSRLLFESLEGRVETLFGESVRGIEQADDRIEVEFERSRPRSFDLVIGSDGLHSEVRRLVFGPQARFEQPLGYTVAAFECLSWSRGRVALVGDAAACPSLLAGAGAALAMTAALPAGGRTSLRRGGPSTRLPGIRAALAPLPGSETAGCGAVRECLRTA